MCAIFKLQAENFGECNINKKIILSFLFCIILPISINIFNLHLNLFLRFTQK
jgi:hypothetical protein